LTNLILQPAGDAASRRNYEKTIRTGIALADPNIHSLLTIQERLELEALAPGGRLRLWGAKPGEDNRAKGKWDRIAPGDYVLFSFGKGEVGVAQVISKLHNARLAEHLWGQTKTRNGRVQTWEYIFAVGEPRPRTIDLAGLNRSLGRKENANIQEFNVLYPEASANGLDFLSLEQVPASPAPATRQTRKPQRKLRAVDTDKIQTLDALDEYVRATRRLEQQALRDYLMAEDTATCALCGRHFPIAFLVAAHIKPRAKCTDEEKRDIANVAMPNCKMGCDELYGRGLISVGADGVITVSPQAPQEGPVAAYVVAHLKDRQCRQWQANPESRSYFQYHHANEFRG
jgi:hypothetical protein